MSEGDEFHAALDREDCDEDLVDDPEGVRKVIRLAVVLHRHGQHVQEDHDHDGDVELLEGGDVEDDQGTLELQQKENRRVQRQLCEIRRRKKINDREFKRRSLIENENSKEDHNSRIQKKITIREFKRT